MTYQLRSPLYKGIRIKLEKARELVKHPKSLRALDWVLAEVDKLAENAFNDGICVECGAKTKEYKHSMSKGLASGLLAIYQAACKDFVILNGLGMDRSRWQNLSKLKYWGLVEQKGTKSGEWRVTDKGEQFILGQLDVPKSVWTYRDEFVRYEGAAVAYSSVDSAGWKQRQQYAKEAQPA